MTAPPAPLRSGCTPLYTTDDIRAIERVALAPPLSLPLMERAGLAAAEVARELLGERGTSVLICAGPGNNGGDALVLARWLRHWYYRVEVMLAADASKLPPDAAAACAAWRAAGGTLLDAPPRRRYDLIVDGLFGIGLARPLEGDLADLVASIDAYGAPVLALDLPSGLASDSGAVLGRAVHATRTVTFIGLKPGLLTLDGPDHCGRIDVAPLGLDAPALRAPRAWAVDAAAARAILPPRRRNSHKGSYGSLGIVGGARGMVGAVLLAGRAALRLGTGRVYCGLIDEAAAVVDPLQPELMLRPWYEVLKLEHLSALAVGPGLGERPEGALAVEHAARRELPLVLDADALNLLAARPALAALVRARAAPTLLTPHPAEAARLLGSSVADVQRDRVAAARELARRYRAGAVLKGAGSVCALADAERWTIHRTGNPGMATAGMGDVLTGLAGALLAQGVDGDAALVGAVALHGAAADHAVAASGCLAGLTASEVSDAARSLANQDR
jgi:hydroxyethylthiazole kinase-like uncharacterized protein yjeF